MSIKGQLLSIKDKLKEIDKKINDSTNSDIDIIENENDVENIKKQKKQLGQAKFHAKVKAKRNDTKNWRKSILSEYNK